MPLTVRVEEKGRGMYMVYSEGTIDANTHTILRSEMDAILKKSPRMIIMDMKDVKYISSAGIAVVLTTEKSMKDHGGDLLMVHLPPQIKKVFDIVQALPSQQIFASVEELDRYLIEMQRKVKDGEIE